VAVYKGHTDIVELLLNNKAEVNAKNDRGMTALHWAAHDGNKDVAKLLVDNKADVNATNNIGETPLHIAARDDGEELSAKVKSGRKEVADLLRQHGGRE